MASSKLCKEGVPILLIILVKQSMCIWEVLAQHLGVLTRGTEFIPEKIVRQRS